MNGLAHPDEAALLEAADGRSTAAVDLHLGGCAACAARLEETRLALAALRGAFVPEPPPPFWDAFRRNVSRRIAEERPRVRGRLWFPLAVLSASALVAFLVNTPSPVPAPRPQATAAAVSVPFAGWSALPSVEEDEEWPVLEGLVASGAVDWDEGRGPEAYLAGLSDEDSDALTAAWQAEAGGGAL